MFRRIEPILMAALVLAAACGGAASPVVQATASPTAAATATPNPVTTSVLASGRLDALPSGSLFVNYMDLPQVAGGSIKHAHIAGFVYAVQGTHEMDIEGGLPLMIQAGNAAFIGATITHVHINPSATAANDWIFIGVRPTSSRPLATIVPGQKELYTTADLTQITPGAYMEALSDSRVTANGVDRQAGPSVRVVYVIDGTLTVSGDAGKTGTVSAGQGAYSLPGASLVLTAGPSGAHYLTFSLTPMN